MTSKLLQQVISEKDNFYGEPLLAQNTHPKKTKLEPFSVSIIIPAYNVQSSILFCLASIEKSSFNIKHQRKLEVVIVDDGSTDNTWKIIRNQNHSLNLTALRQTNHGQAQALNTALSVAQGDIIVSCDADMVLGHYAIEHFAVAHQQISNALFTGFRQNIRQTDSRIKSSFISSTFIKDERIIFPIPGWPENMCLTSDHYRQLGQSRSLSMPDNDDWLLPDMTIGALFCLSRKIFNQIGGYDERFVGWGCTDSYLAAKAIGANQNIIPLYSASGLHINHPIRLNNREQQYQKNRKLFFNLIETTRVDSQSNWLLHAKDRIIESLYRSAKSPVRKSKNMIPVTNKFEDKLLNIDQLLSLGQYSKVLTNLNRNTKTINNPAIQLRLAKAFSGIKHYQKAIDILEQISSPKKLFIKNKIDLAVNQAANNNFESALNTLKDLANKLPRTPELSYWLRCPANKHVQQGKKYFDQKFFSIAVRCFEAALIVDPKNKIALKYRNECLKQSSNMLL